MLNLEEDKTALKVLVADTYDDLIRTSSEEAIDHLNWTKVRMTPLPFYLQIQKWVDQLNMLETRKIFV